MGACWTLDQMVATLEPLRQLPTMPEPEQSQSSSSSSPCQACALIMSTRARWEKCAATAAPPLLPLPCPVLGVNQHTRFSVPPFSTCIQKFVLCFVNFFLAANLFSFTFFHCSQQRAQATLCSHLLCPLLRHVAKNNAWVSVQ